MASVSRGFGIHGQCQIFKRPAEDPSAPILVDSFIIGCSVTKSSGRSLPANRGETRTLVVEARYWRPTALSLGCKAAKPFFTSERTM